MNINAWRKKSPVALREISKTTPPAGSRSCSGVKCLREKIYPLCRTEVKLHFCYKVGSLEALVSIELKMTLHFCRFTFIRRSALYRTTKNLIRVKFSPLNSSFPAYINLPIHTQILPVRYIKILPVRHIKILPIH
jgi:hypothetical protein